MGNLKNLLTNPSSAIDTQAALVEAVLLDEAAETSGTVTSVALTMPAEFTVAGSPITANGTIAVTKANEAANKVFAGPATGSPAAPTFRSLATADLPAVAGVAGTYTVISSITIDATGRVTAITGT